MFPTHSLSFNGILIPTNNSFITHAHANCEILIILSYRFIIVIYILRVTCMHVHLWNFDNTIVYIFIIHVKLFMFYVLANYFERYENYIHLRNRPIKLLPTCMHVNLKKNQIYMYHNTTFTHNNIQPKNQ